jgi:glycosyltransferase involved in cell wall biosynthesis
MLNVIERLDRRRFAPAVCVRRKGGALDKVVERLGIPFLETPFTLSTRPYPSLPARIWRAAQPFRAYRFTLWHSFNYNGDFTEPLIARMAGAKAWMYTKKSMGWRWRWYVRTLLAARIAAQNTDMMRSFFRAPPFRGRARVIPPGVVTETFHPEVPSRLWLRKRHNLAEATTLIGSVAELLPVKGHPTLLHALASLPDAHLFLAGRPFDAAYVTSLHELVGTLGLTDRVTFLDYVGDVPAFLAEMDVFVLPTWARWRMEGCPVALLEAMSTGRACVASDIPGCRDVIASGQNGLLVPPENAVALSGALSRLAADPDLRRRLGREARARIEQHYRIEREVADYEAMYAELLERRP